MKTYTVYGLRVPGEQDFFYIGMTGKSLNERLAGHINHAKSSRQADNSRAKRIVAANFKIDIVEIETPISQKPKALEREQYWIGHYRGIGCQLTNSSRVPQGVEDMSVLRLMAEGFTATQSGKQLGVCSRTIEGCLTTMRKRHGARTNGHLITIAWGLGLLGCN